MRTCRCVFYWKLGGGENSARRSRKGGAEQGTSGVTVLALYGGWILIEAQRIKLLKIRLSLLVLFLVLLHLPRRPPFPSSISAFRLATTANHFLFASFLSRGFLLIPANQTFYTRRTSRFRGLSNQLWPSGLTRNLYRTLCASRLLRCHVAPFHVRRVASESASQA